MSSHQLQTLRVDLYMCCVLGGHKLASGIFMFFFFQAEDGIRDLVRSRGLGDVYKRQRHERDTHTDSAQDTCFGGVVCDKKRNQGDGEAEELSLIHI